LPRLFRFEAIARGSTNVADGQRCPCPLFNCARADSQRRGPRFYCERQASILITRDQFNITPQGVTHKPTDASFTPQCGDPLSGNVRLGQLGNGNPMGDNYDPDVVKKIMTQLWTEYVAANWNLFYEDGRRDIGSERRR